MLNSLTERFNYELLTRQEARIIGDKVIVSIFRGSPQRGNRHKVAELKIPLSQATKALNAGEWASMVWNMELELDIPLYVDKNPWAIA